MQLFSFFSKKKRMVKFEELSRDILSRLATGLEDADLLKFFLVTENSFNIGKRDAPTYDLTTPMNIYSSASPKQDGVPPNGIKNALVLLHITSLEFNSWCQLSCHKNKDVKSWNMSIKFDGKISAILKFSRQYKFVPFFKYEDLFTLDCFPDTIKELYLRNGKWNQAKNGKSLPGSNLSRFTKLRSLVICNSVRVHFDKQYVPNLKLLRIDDCFQSPDIPDNIELLDFSKCLPASLTELEIRRLIGVQRVTHSNELNRCKALWHFKQLKFPSNLDVLILPEYYLNEQLEHFKNDDPDQQQLVFSEPLHRLVITSYYWKTPIPENLHCLELTYIEGSLKLPRVVGAFYLCANLRYYGDQFRCGKLTFPNCKIFATDINPKLILDDFKSFDLEYVVFLNIYGREYKEISMEEHGMCNKDLSIFKKTVKFIVLNTKFYDCLKKEIPVDRLILDENFSYKTYL